MFEALASQVSNSRIFPPPWSLGCKDLAGPIHDGFPVAPNQVSNLSLNADPYDMVWKLLRTTRQKEIDRRTQEVRAARGLKRAPNGERNRQDRYLH
jgi:hypothetical protein